MNLIYLVKKKLILCSGILLMASTAMAQSETASAEKAVASDNNQLEMLLVAIAFFLVFVIWAFGQVLLVLSKQLLEKNKTAAKVVGAILIATLLFSSQTSSAQSTSSSEAVKVVSNYGGLSATAFYFFAAVIAIEVIAILFLYFSIRNVYKELAHADGSVKSVSRLKLLWSKLDRKIFTKAVPMEREADYLLDHNYDGIQELDNALPPWWKYGFYITIVVAVIYLLNFHVFGIGKNPTQEYAAEMEQAKVQKEIYEAKNKDKIDENNIPVADAAGIAKGKEIFANVCWACHGKSGEGGAGPNLTDDYWLHKGSLNDIYHTIKVGYPDKGMQSWSSVYSPKEISYLASYVKSLHGTHPANAKAPQGDLYQETDSTRTIKPDSANARTATIDNKKVLANEPIKN
ncbi:MAG TPA: cbb3-type cytochrome c oxidase N-terminal domain-containing protein [Puia sp.]|nr:cbb3-type cytochrome c oxidase N-terminal domain-containing protein [Puia sp.]